MFYSFLFRLKSFLWSARKIQKFIEVGTNNFLKVMTNNFLIIFLWKRSLEFTGINNDKVLGKV